MRASTFLAIVSGLASLLAAAPSAQAGGSWIYRGITRPDGEVAIGFGFGMGRQPLPMPMTGSITGVGMNLEISGGLGRRLELGLRTGIRFGSDGRVTQADQYGRPFETETYGAGFDPMANPEIRLRGALTNGGAAELALEIRAYLPFDDSSRFGLMFGVPITLRVGILRIDTGLYVPILFYDPTYTIVSVPVALWFQPTSRLWLGPLFGVRVFNDSYEQYPFGFGLGTMLSHAVDLRTWFLFPDMSGAGAARTWGAGFGLEFRF